MIPKMQKQEEFGQWLLSSRPCSMNQAMNQERDNTMKQVIQKAKQYIMDNYQDPDLSVEKICRHLHMSPAYFSTMFKKETGQAYIAYLTEVRLDKAVELLNKTDDKTYVIAAKVGYQEQNYFSYVFKKAFRRLAHQIPGGQISEEDGHAFEKAHGICFRIASIRYTIFIYFTVTALAASIFIGLSMYSRHVRARCPRPSRRRTRS